MSLSYALGLGFGIAVGLGFAAVLVKKKLLSLAFDERQERARGKAYQYGFFAMMAALWVYGLSTLFAGEWCDALVGSALCICAGIFVFAVTAMLKDAYLSFKERPKTVMTLLILLSAVNLGIGWAYFASGALTEQGRVTFRAVNPIVGALTLVIFIVYLINMVFSGREEE